MKLPIPNIQTDSSGMLLEQAFGVGNVGLIFEILRNKMYKNPVMAIAREITCNARDAHREIGTPDRPIEVSLPNAFSPEYRVKDFGPGISPERMSNVFIQYASSTKRNDNFQTGGFGLGAKTPFSYADTFSIITITNGVKRTYNAYIDETRVGKMALSSEKQTDEPSGTTIIVPVLKKDFEEFINSTIISTEYWNVKPILTGVNPIPKYKNNKILYTGNKWALYKKSIQEYNYGYKSNSIAIIDGIGYLIETGSLASLDEFNRVIISNPFIFYFENGEISLSASRDSIHYDEKTQKLIEERIKLLTKEVIEIIDNKIQKCASYKEACALYQQTINEFNNPSQLDTALRGILWHKQKLILDPQAIHIGKYAKLASYVIKKGKVETDRYVYKISYEDNVKLFHNDKSEEKVPKKLIDYFFTNNPNIKMVQVISTPKEPTTNSYQYEVKAGRPPVVSYDMVLIDMMGAEKLSTIVIPKIKAVRKPRGQNKTTITAYDFSIANDKLSCHLAEIPNTGGIYITINYKLKSYTSGNISLPYNFNIRLLEEFLCEKFYGFTDVRAKKLNASWITLEQAIKNKIKKMESEIKEQTLIDDCIASNWLFSYCFESYLEINKYKKLLDDLSEDSLFLKYFQKSEKVEKNIKTYKSYIYVLQLINKDFKPPVYNKFHRDTFQKDKTKLFKLYDEVNSQYPLLKQLNRVYDKEGLQNVIEYIKLVDEDSVAVKNKIKESA